MVMVRRAQMKIQQMAFMLVAVFIFFTLVGLFLLNVQLKTIQGNAQDLDREKALSSLETITNMGELTCSSGRELCIDEDKLRIMSGSKGEEYSSFWQVSSLKVYKIYPEQSSLISCPGLNCNLYEIYDSHQANTQEYSTFISLCKKVREQGYIYERCEIAKLVVGMRIV